MRHFVGRIVVFITFLLFSIKVETSAKLWKIDKTTSEIGFSISNFGNEVTGKFSDYQANIFFDIQNLSKSKVDVSIEVKSIDTQEPKRDKHLQEKSYFHSAKFPQIRFVSSKFERIADGKFIVYGSLTIKGTEKQVALPFGARIKADRLYISLQNKINRKDFNVGTGLAAGVAIGNEVTIRVNLECVSG